jgi:hypothetical protein
MDIRREENSVSGANVVLIYVTIYERSKITKKSIQQWKKILYDIYACSTILYLERKRERKGKKK